MLLIFDLDGTLFQAKPAVLRADYALMDELGVISPDEKTLFKYAGRNLDTFLRHILPEDTDFAAARLRYFELIREAMQESCELFPGIFDMLAQLHEEGHELVVCSNSPEIYIKLVLERTGIMRFITGFYSAEEHESKAELIREIIVKQKVRPPVSRAAVVIGDTHGDVEAAHENGLPAIAVTYGYGNKEMLAAAEYFAETPEEIMDIIRGMTAVP